VTDLVGIQRAFTRICFEAEPKDEDFALLHAPKERWLIYRHMVRHRLFGMMRSGLPKTNEELGKERFDAAVTRYLEERGPRSRYIREVVHELVEHALPGWEADESLPAHLGDLARWESTKWRVSSVEWPAPVPTADELDFEGVPVHNPSVRGTTVRHRIDRKDERQNEALEEPHRLLVYRKPGDTRVFSYVLNAMGADLYDAWQDPDRSFADGVRAVLAAHEREPDAEFVDGMAGVLAGMVEHQIILGSRR